MINIVLFIINKILNSQFVSWSGMLGWWGKVVTAWGGQVN